MATVNVPLSVENAAPVGTVFGKFKIRQGTNFPVSGLHYDDSTDEYNALKFRALGYGSGNLTLDIEWYADTATSGNVVLSGRIAAITPETDTQDVETKALATANTVTDSHLGTTAKRKHRATITISNLDALAADDEVYLVFGRVGTNASDTLVGDIIITDVNISYSDT